MPKLRTCQGFGCTLLATGSNTAIDTNQGGVGGCGCLVHNDSYSGHHHAPLDLFDPRVIDPSLT